MPSPCGGPVLASLGLDGSLKDLSQQYHRGACPRNGIYLSRLSSITVARDGSLVANDEQYIFVAKPGHDFERVYPAAGHPAYLETDSVTEQFSGDLWFRPGPFDHTQCAIMHLRAGSTPLVAKCSATQAKAATLPVEAPAKSLFDIEYFTSLAVESDPDTFRITATYRGSAYADTPKIDSDARAVDFELSDVNDASAAPIRLYPAAARVATVEFDDPDVKHNDFSIAVELPHDRPGLYRLSVRPGSALRAPDGVAVPLATDEERGYVFIASLPAAGADADVDQAKLAYAGHDVTLQTEVTLDCGPSTTELLPGDRLHVVGIARIKGGAVTGYGPSGSHEHPPGDPIDAFAPFLSLHPVGVTFANPFDPSEACDPLPFADLSDIRRSLTVGT